MINIKEIEWKNFMGYGDYISRIDFNKINGVSFIYGENQDDPDSRNGTGKSSIVQALVWCLYGKTTSDEKPGNGVVNWFTGRDCMVKIKTHDDYEIIRTRGVGGKDELLILKDGDDITRSTNTNAQEQLSSIFKIDYRTFISSCVFGQGSEGFIGLTEAKRRSVLERFMKMGAFAAYSDTAKSKIEPLAKQFAEANSKLSFIQNEIDSLKSRIDSCRDKSSLFETQRASRISKIKTDLQSKKLTVTSEIEAITKKIAQAEEQYKQYFLPSRDDLVIEWDAHNRILASLNTLQESINANQLKASSISTSLSKDRERLEQLRSELSAIPQIDLQALKNKWDVITQLDNAIRSKIDLQSNLQSDINTINSRISDFNTREKRINDLGPICDRCDQKIDDSYKHECLELIGSELTLLKTSLSKSKSDLESVKSLIEKTKIAKNERMPKYSYQEAERITNRRSSLEQDILRLDKNVESSIKLLNELESSITNDKERLVRVKNNVVTPQMTISELDAKINNRRLMRVAIEQEQSKIDRVKADFKTQIESASKSIREIQDEVNLYDDMISSLNQDIEVKNQSLTSITNEKEKYDVLIKHLEYIKDSYGNKKKIKAFWISQLIPYLNERIKYYLNVFNMKCFIYFDEYLNIKSDRWSYSFHSGGQKMRFNLSLMFALNDLHTSIFGNQSNIMILDEVDGALDPAGLESFVTLIGDDIIHRKDGPSNILVISHRLEMKDRFPHRISVKNRNEQAYIVDE